MADDVTIEIRLAQVEAFIRDSKRSGAAIREVGEEVEKADRRSRLASVAAGGFGLLRRALTDITRVATATTIAAGATAVILGTQAVSAASDLGETLQKTDQVFGKTSESMKNWGKTTAASLGMSKNDALSAASNYGNLFLNLGATSREAALMSKQLVVTAADLASFNNASPQEMLDAMSSALAGEYDPLQRYGFAISAAAVEQKAMALGLADSKEKLSAADKAQASYKLILEQTGKAQGDFTRNGEGLANMQRKLAAQWEDLKGRLGKALLPAVLAVVRALNDELLPSFNDWVSDHGPAVTRWITGFVTGSAIPFARWILDTATKNGPKFISWLGDMRDKGVAFLGWVDQLTEKYGPKVDEFFTNFDASMGSAGEGSSFSGLGASLEKLAESLGALGSGAGQGVADTLNVAGVAMGWLADHTGLLAKMMPYLVVALIAYKGAQAASNAMSVFAVPLKIAEIIANSRLAASQRALATSLKANTTALKASAGATATDTAAKNTGVVASVRHRVATVASTVATRAAAIATRTWAIAMRVLNTVMRLNPVGLIVTGVILLIGAFVLAYRRVGWFRAGVQASFKLVLGAVRGVWNWIQRTWTRIGDVLANPIDAAVGLVQTSLDAIGSGFRNLINFVIGLWNGLDLTIKIPGWMGKVPGFPDGIAGQSVDLIPDIPLLAKGGRAVAPGVAVIGEEGPELIQMPTGAQVVPLDPSVKRDLRLTDDRPITVQFVVDRRVLAEQTIRGRDDLAARR